MKIIALVLALTVLSATAYTGTYTFHSATDAALILTSTAITNTTANIFNGTYAVTSHASTAALVDTSLNQALCLNSATSNYTITAAASITDGFVIGLTCSGTGGAVCSVTASEGALVLSSVVAVTYTSDTSVTVATAATTVTVTQAVAVSGGVYTATFSIASGVSSGFPTSSTKYLACWPNFNAASSALNFVTSGSALTVSGRTNQTMGNAFSMFSAAGAVATMTALFYGLF